MSCAVIYLMVKRAEEEEDEPSSFWGDVGKGALGGGTLGGLLLGGYGAYQGNRLHNAYSDGMDRIMASPAVVKSMKTPSDALVLHSARSRADSYMKSVPWAGAGLGALGGAGAGVLLGTGIGTGVGAVRHFLRGKKKKRVGNAARKYAVSKVRV